MNDADIIAIVISALLVLLAGLLVTAEAALGRVSRARMRELADDGSKQAARVAHMVEDRPRYVNSLLFTRIACQVAATALMTEVFVHVIANPTVAVLVAVAVMLVVTFIFVGVAPRTLGQQHADRVAMASSAMVSALATVLSPLASLFILIGNAVTPGKGYRQGPFATQTELREMVDQAGVDQVIEDEERQMIHSVFELSDTIAREVMVPRTEMVYIESGKNLRQAMSLHLRSGFSRIPVIGDDLDDVIGVSYVKDVARELYAQREPGQVAPVDDVMRPAFYAPDTEQADDLLRDLQSARVHVAILVDEYGGTAGLVTIEDILEEIVGEIADEYDVDEQPDIIAEPDGSWTVSARLPLDTLAARLSLRISEESEDVETVAGLLARRLGVVPIPGSSVEVDGYEFIAESVGGRRKRIDTVRVRQSGSEARADAGGQRASDGKGAVEPGQASGQDAGSSEQDHARVADSTSGGKPSD